MPLPCCFAALLPASMLRQKVTWRWPGAICSRCPPTRAPTAQKKRSFSARRFHSSLRWEAPHLKSRPVKNCGVTDGTGKAPFALPNAARLWGPPHPQRPRLQRTGTQKLAKRGELPSSIIFLLCLEASQPIIDADVAAASLAFYIRFIS